MIRMWTGIVVALSILIAGKPALAEERIALVIGNGAYGAIGALRNPPSDARLMARTLRQLGFDVIERIDTDQKGMKRAIKIFGNKLETAGKDAVGLFYYAGHGVQLNGVNYLIPVNVEIQDEADVDIEAVSASGVQAQMAFAGNRLNIIIMDACRNNPFKRGFRSATRGLAKMDATKGTLIAYATSPGDVAADGRGANSPYTEALSTALLTPGLTVERVFKEVRNQVVAATDSTQVPWEASSLTGADFYFTETDAARKSPVAAARPVPAVPAVDKEVVFWQSMANSRNAGDYQAYLDQYPGGAFEQLARSRIAALTEPSTTARAAADHQFDGTWDGWLRTYGGMFESPVEATFRVSVKNSRLQGTVHMYGETRSIKAEVDRDGGLIDGRLEGSLQGYDLHGTVEQGLGDGAALGWKLEYKMARAGSPPPPARSPVSLLDSGTYKVDTWAGGTHYPGTWTLVVDGGRVSGTSEWNCCPGHRIDPMEGTVDHQTVVLNRQCDVLIFSCRQRYTGQRRGNVIEGTFSGDGGPGTWKLHLP